MRGWVSPRYVEHDALSSAAAKGDDAHVQVLLQDDDIQLNGNERSWLCDTPLSLAAAHGHEKVVKMLLADNRVNVNAKTMRGTALCAAASYGQETIVKLLLSNDQINVNALSRYDSQTPLALAVSKGHEAIVKLLLSNDKIDVNASGYRGSTPLALAVSKGHEAIVKLLLSNDKINANASGCCYGQTPLALAVSTGHEAIVKLLLSNDKIDVNASGYRGSTPLALAVSNGHEAIVKLLLSNDKIDVNASGKYCVQNSLALAVSNNSPSTFAPFSHYYRTDWWTPGIRKTALLCAIEERHKPIIQILLADHRISVNDSEYMALAILLCVDAEKAKFTSLATAATSENVTIARLLLEKCDAFASASISQLQAMAAPPASSVKVPSYEETLSTLPGNRRNSHFDIPPPEVYIFFALLMQIMQMLILQARRLQAKLQNGLLTSFDDLSVFPNRRRPPCTTMPWNIWPALVVLWGVCWMFYTPPSTPFTDEHYVDFQIGAPEPIPYNLFSGKTSELLCCTLRHD